MRNIGGSLGVATRFSRITHLVRRRGRFAMGFASSHARPFNREFEFAFTSEGLGLQTQL